MPHCVTERQLTDALQDSAPHPASLAAWNTERANQVLAQVEARRQPPRRRLRRWIPALAAATAIIIAVVTLPMWTPTTGPAAPGVANAAERLVTASQSLQALPNGAFETMIIRSDPYSGSMHRSNTVTIWYDNTGCKWLRGENSKWFLYTIDLDPPTVGVVKASETPHGATSSTQLRTLLLTGTDESSTAAQDDIVFSEASRWLLEGSPVPVVRTALVAMMSRLTATTVAENATDPSGRRAIVMTHTVSTSGNVQRTYFDPSNSQVLASTVTTRGGVLESQRVVTERSVVTELPSDVRKYLGTRKQHLKDPEPYYTAAPRR